MSIDKHLQGENRGSEKEVWEMKNDFFISVGFASVNKDRCKSGLSGRWHFGNVQVWMGCKPLQAGGVMNVRRKIARRSGPPKMEISEMP